MTNDNWLVELSAVEIDGETHAEARLKLTNHTTVTGRGTAHLNPGDSDVNLIGDEIAIARALSDLAHKTLQAAATGIEDITHKRPHLHM